jgi:hypothetical protein
VLGVYILGYVLQRFVTSFGLHCFLFPCSDNPIDLDAFLTAALDAWLSQQAHEQQQQLNDLLRVFDPKGKGIMGIDDLHAFIKQVSESGGQG